MTFTVAAVIGGVATLAGAAMRWEQIKGEFVEDVKE